MDIGAWCATEHTHTFLVVTTAEVLLTSGGWRPRMLLNGLRGTGQFPTPTLALPARSDPASHGPVSEFTREPVTQIDLCLQPPQELLASDQLDTKTFRMNSFMIYLYDI